MSAGDYIEELFLNVNETVGPEESIADELLSETSSLKILHLKPRRFQIVELEVSIPLEARMTYATECTSQGTLNRQTESQTGWRSSTKQSFASKVIITSSLFTSEDTSHHIDQNFRLLESITDVLGKVKAMLRQHTLEVFGRCLRTSWCILQCASKCV